jgi:hypothetical protein
LCLGFTDRREIRDLLHFQTRRQRQETIRELSVCIADLFGADRTPMGFGLIVPNSLL